MDEPRLNRQVEQQLQSLRREFGEKVPASFVTALGQAQFEQLRANAKIPDFIPVLVYRFAREELIRIGREDLHRAA